MLKIEAISAFSDNYIWCIQSENYAGQAYVVDPGDAKAVIEHLEAQQLTLKGVLITHWHPDHIGGLADLQAYTNNSLTIYAPFSEKIPDTQVSQRVEEAQTVNVFDMPFKIMEIPGHTLDHIAYFNEATNTVFCGDTLFSGGCGRIFEGTAEMMHNSLQRLAKLPPQTQVYCAHEYTQSNLHFACAVEPNNPHLQTRFNEVQKLRANGKITLPTSIETELAHNPFLRVNTQEVCANVQQYDQSLLQQANVEDWQVLGSLREWKNNF